MNFLLSIVSALYEYFRFEMLLILSFFTLFSAGAFAVARGPVAKEAKPGYSLGEIYIIGLLESCFDISLKGQFQQSTLSLHF